MKARIAMKADFRMPAILRPFTGRPALLAGLLMAAGLGASLLWGHGIESRAAAPASAASSVRPALSVQSTALRSTDWPFVIGANGSIAAWQEAVIGAEIGGLKLLEVKAHVGDVVRRGQVLATLQPESVSADVAATRASLSEAQAVLAEARANAERARQLQTGSAISAQQAQQSATAEQTAAARVDALKARLGADELRLSQTRITAPDDGVISARVASVGSVVQPGQELFRLIRQQRLEWRAEVPATELARIRPGSTVNVQPAGAPAVRGKVRIVAPTVDPVSRNGLVYVDLAAAPAVRAGMFARGEFELGRSPARSLPQSAVLLRDGFSYVFRVGSDNRVAQTKVVTGRRQGDRVEIVDGLADGVKVVASGAGFLADGDTVRVVDTQATAATSAAR
jgi:RND family efflux transporter MFP subunit